METNLFDSLQETINTYPCSFVGIKSLMGKWHGKSVLCLQKDPTTLAVLDAYQGNDIKKLNQLGNKLLKYQMEYYSVLANQRSKIFDHLCDSKS